jgi:hypothetical protein
VVTQIVKHKRLVRGVLEEVEQLVLVRIDLS